MTFIHWCLIIMGGLGVAFGVGLALASRIFHVDIDPRIEGISDKLPGANCGACGFAGCAAYAEKVAQGAAIDLCIPGGSETTHAVAHVMGMEAGVALNPETGLSDIVHLIPDLDTILFLSVHPGYYGSPFIPEVLEKAREARERYSFITLGIDGGIGRENLSIVRDAGLDYACVGSRIFRQADPAAAYGELCEAAGV